MTRVEVKFQDLTIDTKVVLACPVQCENKRQASKQASKQYRRQLRCHAVVDYANICNTVLQVYVGNRALPSVINAYRNALEVGV